VFCSLVLFDKFRNFLFSLSIAERRFVFGFLIFEWALLWVLLGLITMIKIDNSMKNLTLISFYLVYYFGVKGI